MATGSGAVQADLVADQHLREIFDEDAQLYDRARPGYPEELLDDLAGHLFPQLVTNGNLLGVAPADCDQLRWAPRVSQPAERPRNTRQSYVWRMEPWEAGAPGVVRLPSGRLVRGRGLRHPLPAGLPPEFGLYLAGREPTTFGWPWRWLPWPDWRLPGDPSDARAALTEAWQRAATERVEVACHGGVGRTGTALARLVVLDGVPGADAVRYVRQHYRRRAVETPGQRAYVRRFDPA